MSEAEIRLSGTSYAVLSLLDVLGPSTPYDLKQALERSIQNFWPVPHTTFYAEPARLAQGGFLSERQEPGGRRRKIYALTDRGRSALRAWTSDPSVGPPQLREEGVLKIFAGADPVPIMRARREWHRTKLEELEGYLGAVEGQDAWEGVRQSLLVGIGYERLMVDAIGQYLDTLAAADTPAAGDTEAGADTQAATGAQAATGSS